MKKLLVFAVAMFCVPFRSELSGDDIKVIFIRSELSEETKLLFKAICEGDVSLARKALATERADESVTNEEGETPLSLAVKLYRKNVEDEARRKDFGRLIGLLEPPMSEERVKFLLKVARSRGTSSLRDFFPCINARDENGYTPLHYAAAGWLGDPKTACEELLSYGADVTAKDYRGNATPLDIALYCVMGSSFSSYYVDWKEDGKVFLFDAARFIKIENPSSFQDALYFLVAAMHHQCNTMGEPLQSRTEEKKSIKSNL